MEQLFQELDLAAQPPLAPIRQVALLADLQSAAIGRLSGHGVLERLCSALPENDYEIVLGGFLGALVCRMGRSGRPADAPQVAMVAYRHVGTDPDEPHYTSTVFQNICDTTSQGEFFVYPGIIPSDARMVEREVRALELARLLGRLPGLSETCLNIETTSQPPVTELGS